MNKKKNFKEIEKSKLKVKRIVGKQLDQHGREVNLIKWEEVKKEVNLGSFANPKNTDIIQFKYIIPADPEDNPIAKLFGGGK